MCGKSSIGNGKALVLTLIAVGSSLLFALFGVTKAAFAQDFCIGDAPCPSGGISVSGASNEEKLQNAFDQASANGEVDQLYVGTGTYKTSGNGGNDFIYKSDEQLEIVGTVSGEAKTVIEADSPNSWGLVLGALDGSVLESKSKVSNITFKLNSGGSMGGTRGLTLYNGADAENLVVTYGSAATEVLKGVVLSGKEGGYGSSVEDITIDLPDGQGVTSSEGITVACGYDQSQSHSVRDVSIDGALTGVSICSTTFTNKSSLSQKVSLSRLKITDVRSGIRFSASSDNGGQLSIFDTLIVARPGTANVRLLSAAASASNGADASITANRLTVIGNGTPGSTGISSESTVAGSEASINATDSVVHGVATAISRKASSGGTAGISLTRSFYDPSKVTDQNVGAGSGGSIALFNVSAVGDSTDLGFVDSANDDFRLRHDSPLVDKGAVTVGVFASCDPGGAPVYDLAGLCRHVDGDGSGIKAFDVGAYEYGRRAPLAKASVSVQSAQVGEQITFSGSGSSDPDAGDGLTYTWSFSDGSTGDGETVTRTLTTPGSYTGTLTVKDPTGQTGTASVTVEVVASGSLSGGSGGGPSTSGGSAVIAPGDSAPSSKVARPAKASLKRGKLKVLRGTAKDDKGLVRVDLSIVRKAKRNGKTVCYAITSSGKTRRYKPNGKVCAAKFLIKAKGTASWRVALKRALSKGTYTVTSRAKDTKGQLEKVGKQNRITVKVR